MENQKAYFEIERENYPVICLFKHEGLDIANMTKEEFVKIMSKDLMNAQANYEDLMREPLRKARAEYLVSERERAIKFAQSKWKTEKRQNKYVDEMMSKAEASSNYTNTNLNKIWFDINPDKGQLGIVGCCSLYPGDPEDKLSRCFDEIKDSKYFRGGFGWVFRYEGRSMKFPISCGRPDIDILLPEDLAKQQKEDGEKLDAEIEKFYKGTKYFGD